MQHIGHRRCHADLAQRLDGQSRTRDRRRDAHNRQGSGRGTHPVLANWPHGVRPHSDDPTCSPKVDQLSSPAPPAQSPSESTDPQPKSNAAAKPTRAAHEHSASDGAAKPARRAHDHLGRASRRTFSGNASFYAYRSGKTASGSAFNREARTAAHRHLSFGTKLRVTNVANKKSVVVTITDRGPHKPDRVLIFPSAPLATWGL